MMIYPELMLALAHDRQRELVAVADRGRVLASARRAVHARKLHSVAEAATAPARPPERAPAAAVRPVVTS